MATTKEEFQALKAAQAKSDIREKFANSGLGDIDPEASALTVFARLVHVVLKKLRAAQ